MQGTSSSESLHKARQTPREWSALRLQHAQHEGSPQERSQAILNAGDSSDQQARFDGMNQWTQPTLVLRGPRPDLLLGRRGQPRPDLSIYEKISDRAADNGGRCHEDDEDHPDQQLILGQLYRPPSPRIYLDDGEMDHFSALPTDLPRQVVSEQLYNGKIIAPVGKILILMGIMHAARLCLTELVTNANARDVYGPRFAQRILSIASANPVLMYSLMTAVLTFMRTAQNSDRNYALELHTGTKAIQLLSEQMSHPETAATEANIWSVVVLGYCESERELRKGKCPSQSFLKELQSLHIYGRLEVNKAHLQGLIQLVQMLGGLDKIRTPGIAQTIS